MPDLYVAIANQNAIYPNTVMAGMLVVEIMFIKEMVNLVLSLDGACPDSVSLEIHIVNIFTDKNHITHPNVWKSLILIMGEVLVNIMEIVVK